MSNNTTWLACMWQDWNNNYEASTHGKCAKSLLGAYQYPTSPVQHVSCCKDFHRSPLCILLLNTTPKKLRFKGGSRKVQTAPVTNKIHCHSCIRKQRSNQNVFRKINITCTVNLHHEEYHAPGTTGSVTFKSDTQSNGLYVSYKLITIKFNTISILWSHYIVCESVTTQYFVGSSLNTAY
jgi:hypothetical protein